MRHFEIEEFKCRCGCGRVEMDPDFLDRLDEARERAGVPFVITSGYRCPEHDRAIGGSGNHPTGRAVDIRIPDSHVRYCVLKGAFKADFKRIEEGTRHIHLDDCPGRPQEVVWLDESK